MAAPVFVDSSVWIDHFRGTVAPETAALSRILRALDGDDPPEATVIVGDLVMLEVLRGFDDEREFTIARDALSSFTRVTVAGTHAALAAAGFYRRLRRLGVTVRNSVDCLIATWCITHDVPLLHRDRDFAPFITHCGLRVL